MTEEEKKAKELEIAKSLENKLTDLVAAAAENLLFFIFSRNVKSC